MWLWQGLNALGQQDSPKKRRQLHQGGSAWDGSIVQVKKDGVYVLVEGSKWQKAKKIIKELLSHFKKEKGDQVVELDFNRLAQCRGFLVHMGMTYTDIIPYLKGIHLTIDCWRGNRNKQGWKVQSERDWLRMVGELGEGCRAGGWKKWVSEVKTYAYEDHPKLVKAVPRLLGDLKALESLFQGDEPGERLVRGSSIAEVVYGFGDASGLGFGSSWIESSSKKESGVVGYRVGVWREDTEEESSNFRELANLVETLEHKSARGEFDGKEVFFFTDNSTCELAHFKGNSSSEELFKLILRLRVLGMKRKMRLHFIHVAGTCMIDQGTNGLSRGDLTEGVMKGTPMLTFVPLHYLLAISRSNSLVGCLKEWLGQDAEVLMEEEWFNKGHDI